MDNSKTVFSAVGAANSGNTPNGLAGNGSPQGVVSAAPGATYLDIIPENFWVKATGTNANGWVELIGD